MANTSYDQSTWVHRPGWDPDRTVFAVRLRGSVDTARLNVALATAADRLSTSCGAVKNIDLAHLEPRQREAAAQRLVESLAKEPSVGTTGPPVRVALYRLGDDDHVLVAVARPDTAAGTSWVRFALDISRGYKGLPLGTDGSDAAPPVNSPVREDGYWPGFLAGARAWLPLPVDGAATVRTRAAARQPVESAGAMAAAVAAVLHVPVEAVAIAAFAVLLARYGRETDLLLAVALDGPGPVLPLRLSCPPLTTFADVVRQAARGLSRMPIHPDDVASLAAALDAVLVDLDDDAVPVITAAVTLAPTPAHVLRIPSVTTQDFPVEAPVRAALELRVDGSEPERDWVLVHSSEMFAPETARRFAHQLGVLLAAAADRPDTPVRRLPLADGAERNELIGSPSASARDLGASSVVDLLEEASRACPQHTAVIADGHRLTYAELEAASNALAHRLVADGVGPESPVAVLVTRDITALIAMFGVLKAGGVYLPLDPEYPPERLAFIADQAGIAAVVTHPHLRHLIGQRPVPVQLLDPGSVPEPVAAPPVRRLHPDNLAYIIYTSGSTGRPKGVSISHRSALNLTAALRELFELTPEDRVAMFASFGFDASVWEVLLALGSRAGLVLLDPRHQTPGEVTSTMRQTGVTVATLPPAFLRVLSGSELPTIRLLVSAGEACTPGLDRTWSRGRTFVNAYGPTEVTVCATTHVCDGRGGEVPLGRALPGTWVYVLDEQLAPVPTGLVGELYVGGAGVARGYRATAATTAEAFLPDPYGPPGTRIYRTGDLVRRYPGGAIVYVGRVDEQVKVRGHRVETNEVESVLLRHRDVRECAVLAEEDANGSAQLVAYLVLVPEAQHVAGRGEGQLRWQGRSLHRELHEFVAALLPSYMVPTRYVSLARLPVTLSGKIDRAAVKAETPQDVDEPDATVETTLTEKIIAEIWGRHLGLTRVDPEDHFLELGGHSLVAVQVIEDVRRRFEIELSVRVLFDNAVLAEFAAAVDQVRGQAVAATA